MNAPGPRWETRDVPRRLLAIGTLVLLAGGALTLLGVGLLYRAIAREPVRVSRGVLHGAFTDPARRFDGAAIRDSLARADSLASNGYGWVDRANGVVGIPIERAMEAVARERAGAPPASGADSAPARATSARVSVTTEGAAAHSVLLLALAPATPAGATATPPAVADSLLASATFTPRAGARLPAGKRFRDAGGRVVSLGDVLDGRPGVLVLSYRRCSQLCPIVRDEVGAALAASGLSPGRDFVAIDVGIDPRETTIDAAARRAAWRRHFPRAREDAIAALTADSTTIAALAGTAGFRFARDPATGEFAHPAGALVLTPDARISGARLALPFVPRDLRRALRVAAGGGRSPIDTFVLRCYHYAPAIGTWGAAILFALRAAAVLAVIALAGLVVFSRRRGARAARAGARR